MTKPNHTAHSRLWAASTRKQLPTTFWRGTALASTVIALGACGGGDSDKNLNPIDTTSSPYLVYNGNANKHIVLDSTGKQFAVTSKDLKLVYLGTKSSLKGLELTKEGSISSGGKKIADVALIAGSDVSVQQSHLQLKAR